jgi:uncharacterized membrane protein YebE (DUF533 family)
MSREIPPLIQAILGGILGTALADGQLQPQERALLRALVSEFELEDGDLVTSFEELVPPRLAPEGPLSDIERLSIMRYAVLAAQADGSIARTELGFLKNLGGKLGLTGDEWLELEEFSAQLYDVTRGGKLDEKALRSVLKKYLR